MGSQPCIQFHVKIQHPIPAQDSRKISGHHACRSLVADLSDQGEMSEIIPEQEQKLVDDTVAKLSEHFDSVRIFVTRHEGNESNTASYETGGGNFYAQLGQIREWLGIQDQFQRQYARREDAEDPMKQSDHA